MSRQHLMFVAFWIALIAPHVTFVSSEKHRDDVQSVTVTSNVLQPGTIHGYTYNRAAQYQDDRAYTIGYIVGQIIGLIIVVATITIIVLYIRDKLYELCMPQASSSGTLAVPMNPKVHVETPVMTGLAREVNRHQISINPSPQPLVSRSDMEKKNDDFTLKREGIRRQVSTDKGPKCSEISSKEDSAASMV
jgi:hypothetical protein